MPRTVCGLDKKTIKDQIKSLYLENCSCRDIARTLDLNHQTIATWMKQMGLSTSHLSSARKVSLVSQKDNIIKLYNDGNNLNQIAQLYNTRGDKIRLLLEKYGVTVVDFEAYSINDKFWEHIETEEQAWALGLMITDGWVNKNYFALQLIDLETVEKFKTILQYGGKITTRLSKFENRQDQYNITINNTKMVKDLEKFGVVRAKSFDTFLPGFDLVPEHLYPPLLRGLYEGDGSIRKNNLVITGTHKLLTGIQDFWRMIFPNIEFSLQYQSQTGKDTYNLCLYRNDGIKRCLDFIYNGAKWYMQRKYQVWLNHYKGV